MNLFKKTKEKTKNKSINKETIKLTLSIVLFFSLWISFLRVPYVGEFLDAVFFSFIFGWSKFIIYIYLIVLFVMYFIRKPKKPMYSKRAFLLLLITSFLFSCLFSSIFYYMNNSDSTQIFSHYIDYWKTTVFPISFSLNDFVYNNQIFVDGGILGTSVCYLSNIIVIILSIIGILGVYLLLANKHREKIFNFFTKKIKHKEINTISNNNDQSNNNELNHIVDDGYLKSITNDWKKQYLVLERQSTNKNLDMQKIKNNILDFLKNNHIDFIKYSSNDLPSSFSLDFLMDDESYANFKQVSNVFRMAIGNLEYDITYENNTLSISFNKVNAFDNNLLKKILLMNYSNAFDISFLTLDNTPLILNLRKNNLIGVFDPRDNNINNLINNIIYSLSWTYKTQQLKIHYLSTKNICLDSFQSPNFNKVDVTTTKDATIFLKNIIKEIKELLKEFKKRNVNDIYSYNSLISKPIPNRIILINDFNQMININPEIKTYINEILKFATKCGINIITFDKSSDAITYNNFNYNTSLLFKASIDVSKRILNSSIAVNLHANNSAILYNSNNMKMFEVYVPQINDNEQKIIISSLSECFKNKNF